MDLLQVKLNICPVFYPETDGHSEHMFRKTEEMLRVFVSYAQKAWALLLRGTELAYNSYENKSTKKTPFLSDYGQQIIIISDFYDTVRRK